MKTLRLTLAAAALSLTASLAPAATVGGYTSFFAFGDSLTDNGNLFAASGLPPFPYVAGRFSNGPTWAEYVAARFAKAGLFAANFAFGGATAVTNADAIPDLQAQLFIAATNVPPVALGANPLVSLFFGANDILDELKTPGVTEASAVAVAGAAGKAVANAAGFIFGTGITSFVLFNLPDLGTIPRFAALPAAAAIATAATDEFNKTLAASAATLRAGGARVIEIDINSLFEDLLDDPTRFGLTNATDPCFTGVSLCSAQEAMDRAFFDDIHPNARVHQVIAGNVLAAIPLPASALMLLAGLAGLAALRRRAA